MTNGQPRRLVVVDLTPEGNLRTPQTEEQMVATLRESLRSIRGDAPRGARRAPSTRRKHGRRRD